MKYTFTEVEKEYIRKNYLLMSNVSIGKTLKVPGAQNGKNTVGRFLFEDGIVRPKCSDFDHTYLDVIDTPDKAYLYGLFLSDGTVDSYGWGGITLKKGDCSVLEGIVKNIKHKKGLREYSPGYLTLTLHSDSFISNLIRNGCVPRKSYLDISNCFLPEGDLFWPFLTGFIDGDGSVVADFPVAVVGFTQGRYNVNLALRLRTLINSLLDTKGHVCIDKASGKVDITYRRFESQYVAERLYVGVSSFIPRKREERDRILSYDFSKGRYNVDMVQVRRLYREGVVSPLDMKKRLGLYNYSTVRSSMIEDGLYESKKYNKGTK